MEAAYCSNGRCLYVFGGTRTCVSNAAFARMISHSINQFSGTEMPDTEALVDLWVLDLASGLWTQLSDDALPGYSGPSPRSFGALAFDSTSNSLLLFGGLPAQFSLNPKVSSSCNNDLWRYDLTSRVWTRIIGQHPRCPKAGPCAVHGGGLFVVDAQWALPSNNTEIMRYDIASGRWSKRWCGGGGPVLESPVTGWAQDGRMYVFGVDRGSSSKTTSLWHVSLDTHAAGWQPIIVVGDGAAPRIKGQVSTFWSEGAASYNPVSRKAYVFGGWNVHFNELTIAADSGQLQQLEGRYWRRSAAALCVRALVCSGFNIRVTDHMPVFVLLYCGASSCAVLQILRLAVGV
jgi:hypothetical protein